jgi:hypothetical protein
VPQLRNIDWGRDRQLQVIPLARVSVQRHVGLLERRQHPRQGFTNALRQYFDGREPALRSKRSA